MAQALASLEARKAAQHRADTSRPFCAYALHGVDVSQDIVDIQLIGPLRLRSAIELRTLPMAA